jgi:hypothetical protein
MHAVVLFYAHTHVRTHTQCLRRDCIVG